MRYYNQLNYPDVPYITDTDHPGSEFEQNGTIKMAGCGLCALCMVVDRLCLEPFTLEECRDLSVSVGANYAPGTSLKILAPVIADKFDLHLEMTDDPGRLARCLRQGGAAIVHVGGDREGHAGVFSHGGHYVAALGVRGEEFCILDPSWKEDKYVEEPRRSAVRQHGVWLYTTARVLQEDTANRSPGYYLFERNSDRAGEVGTGGQI